MTHAAEHRSRWLLIGVWVHEALNISLLIGCSRGFYFLSYGSINKVDSGMGVLWLNRPGLETGPFIDDVPMNKPPLVFRNHSSGVGIDVPTIVFFVSHHQNSHICWR